MIAATSPKELTHEAWHALYSMEGPENKEIRFRKMEGIFPRLPYGQQKNLKTYLLKLILNGADSDGSRPKLRYWDITMGTIVVDLAAKLLEEYGKVPDEFYRALEVLPLHDERTRRVLGETQSKNLSQEKRLSRIRDIASADDAEAAFRIMNRQHEIYVPYQGMRQDHMNDEAVRDLGRRRDSSDRGNYLPEEFEGFDFSGSREEQADA